MKHAFLIVAHKSPELLCLIAKKLESSNHYMYVHIDKKVDDAPFRAICKEIRHVKFYHDINVNWGGYSQIQCTINLLKAAFNDNMDYYHLISGQDYPCKSNQEFDAFFEKNKCKSFMYYDTEEEAKLWRLEKYPYRYMYWHFTDTFIFRNKHLHLLSNYIAIIFNKLFKRKPLERIYAGWNWFSWSKKVVEYVLLQNEKNKPYFKRFHFTTCCDEIIFHTLLANHLQELEINPNNSLRFVEWSPKRHYTGKLPLVLQEMEYNDIVKSNAFFCRKVELPVSIQLIKMLDNQ